MTKSIKHLSTVALFSLSTILFTGYIAPVQAIQEAVVEKEVLHHKLEAIWKEKAKETMLNIEKLVKKNKIAQLKLQKKLQQLLNFSLKAHKKHFFKMPFDQLQVICSKMENLKAIDKKSKSAIEALFNLFQQLCEENLKNGIKTKIDLQDPLQKKMEEEINLAFEQMINLFHSQTVQANNDLILLADDSKVMYDYIVSSCQQIQIIVASLPCSLMEQQSFLANLKKVNTLMGESLEVKKDLMAAIPHILKKNLQKLGKQISQAVHKILYRYTKLDQALMVSDMILFD
ncbi:hypothetical protein ACRRVB_04730 [Candidatus Cardinium hertigii]|uniref:hypothetical protein n=1 Tax=Candidatus Cardinium hertigii TaxID=247481 RepID=UPI003D7CEA74